MPRFPHPIEESGVDETIGTPPSTVLRPAHESKNKKSLLIATFLRLGIVASSPDRRLRPESTAKWLYCGSFPLCGSEGESPIAKKLQKARYFCFLRLADRRDGANPAKDESHTHRNQGMHLQSDKKPPEGGFVLKYMAGPAGFPRSASALPLGASACRQIPKNVPQARFLYGISPHRFEPWWHKTHLAIAVTNLYAFRC